MPDQHFNGAIGCLRRLPLEAIQFKRPIQREGLATEQQQDFLPALDRIKRLHGFYERFGRLQSTPVNDSISGRCSHDGP